MGNPLQSRRGSVLVEFIFVIPIYLAMFAWLIVNVQYGRAVIRLEAMQRVMADAYVLRGASDRRAQAIYDFLVKGVAGKGVFKHE